MAPPPLKSKYQSGPTTFELKYVNSRRSGSRNAEKKPVYEWRGPSNRKRAELKTKSHEEQVEAAERARTHQATYREKHRRDLRLGEAQQRSKKYEARYGQETAVLYTKALRDRHRRGRDKRRAKAMKAGYFPEDEVPDGVDDRPAA
ncbi:hypothetical protein FB451DRAFT_1399007 [Mycena latifolia]|nr:hypothetical protein FB451DRAFT_1399007 [Mycena latifolia]